MNLFGIVERAKVGDIALNQMLGYPFLSEEGKKELEWLPEKVKETVDILCERAEDPFWCDEQWIISEQFENEKGYRKFLRKISGQEYYIPNRKEIEFLNAVGIMDLLFERYVEFSNRTRANHFVENCSEWVYSVLKWSNRGFTDRELGKQKIIPSEKGLPEISK